MTTLRMHRAQQLLFKDAMGSTDDLLSQGQMSNLNVHSVEGINWVVHCSFWMLWRGRSHDALQETSSSCHLGQHQIG